MIQEQTDILALFEKSNQHFKTADHIVYMTYPLVKDNKLIAVVLENLNQALQAAIEALLHYEKLYKRIGPFPENFYSRIEIFKNKIAPIYNIERGHIVLIEEIRNLVQERKESKMEFIRQDKYIICNNDYSRIKAVNMDKLKSYINELKPFMRKVNLILQNVRR